MRTSSQPTVLSQVDWTEGLRAHALAWRATLTLPTLDEADPLLRALAEVQGGGFANFVQEQVPRVLEERDLAAQIDGAVVTPTVVWVTDEPGMVAAALMLEPDASHMLAVPEAVFEAWMDTQSDWHCRHHIEYIAVFSPLDDDDLNLLTDTQRASESKWLIHKVGIIWGEDAGHEARHLWRWHEGTLMLEEQNFRGAIVY